MINRITIELPSLWINDYPGGERNYKFFYHFMIEACNLGIPLNIVRHEYNDDGVTRYPAQGEFIFSYFNHNDKAIPNVACVKESSIFDLYAIDLRGYSRWSSLVTNPEWYASDIENMDEEECEKVLSYYRNAFLKKNISKYAQPSTNIACNIQGDYVLMYLQGFEASLLTEVTMEQAILKLAELAYFKKVPFVIKPHPLVKSAQLDYLLQYVKQTLGAFVVDASVHELAKRAFSIVSVNSSASLEALITNPKVNIFNLAPCEWSPCSTQIDCVSDLELCFNRDYHKSVNKKYLGFLLSKFWINVDDRPAIANKIKKVLGTYSPSYYSKLRQSVGQLGAIRQTLGIMQHELAIKGLLENVKH